ncbi:MAG: hypothetical protein ACTHJZ_22200 [Trinickia sp.]
MGNRHCARLEGAASVAGASGHEGGPSTAAAHAKQAAARVAPVNH